MVLPVMVLSQEGGRGRGESSCPIIVLSKKVVKLRPWIKQ